MNVSEIAVLATKEIGETLAKIDEVRIQDLISVILSAKKIYVAGAGRSLLMLRGIAMRLMHLGFESYVVGDTTTPAFEQEDLLIVGSGSGETVGLISVVNKAKEIGGKVALLTVKPASTLAKLADIVIEIPAFTDKVEMKDAKQPILPGGSLFEQSLLVLGDSIVMPLSKKMDIPINRAFSRHANLE